MLNLKLENKAIGRRPTLHPGEVARRCLDCQQLFAVGQTLLEQNRAPERCEDCRPYRGSGRYVGR